MTIRICSLLGILCLVAAAFGQQSLESEAWKFAQAYDQAIVRSDVAFMEKHLDEQFISIGPNSLIISRAESIAQAKKAAGENAFRVIELKSTPIKTTVSGDLVVITTNWKVVRQATAVVNAPPQTDSGSTTAVFRKEGDIWQIVSEHVGFDAAREDDEIGRIGRSGLAFNRSLVNRNYNDAEKFLSPSYLRVDSDGTSWNSARFMTDLRDGKFVVSSLRTSNVYVNRRKNTAVETGLVKAVGARNGIPFSADLEFTRLWTKTDDTWRITGEYFTQPVSP